MNAYQRRIEFHEGRFAAAVRDGLTNRELKERFPMLPTTKLMRLAAKIRAGE